MRRTMYRCLLCNDTLESLYRHDFQTCRCGNLSVDGGDGPSRADEWTVHGLGYTRVLWRHGAIEDTVQCVSDDGGEDVW